MRNLTNAVKFVIVLILLILGTGAHAQSVPKHYIALNTNNATLVLGRPSLVKMLHVENVTAALVFLKLYNKVTAPVCGTDPVVMTIAVPGTGTTGGYPVVIDVGDGLLFSAGVGFCMTNLIADNDNTPVAAGSMVLNIGVTGH